LANNLFEKLTNNFFSSNKTKTDKLNPEDIDQNLEDEIPIGFMDIGGNEFVYSQKTDREIIIKKQDALIDSYRNVAFQPEVDEAINIIIDEAIFSPGNSEILGIDFTSNEIPDEIKDKLNNELKFIIKKINLKKNIYSMFSQFYIDGQLNIHCDYDESDIGSGLKKLTVMSPKGLLFNYKENKWEYIKLDDNYLAINSDIRKREFDREEVIRIDSGIYSNNLILSNLHTSIKTANMLKTLEDMVIPIRFSRSVSRRVFNVDVSNLNNKKAKEFLNDIQAKFKYKKFYNLETGTISNQQHVASLTEDYWFPNREGQKGTSVDTIDETGNLGEITDIVYFKRKLYSSLKIPVSRVNDEGEPSTEFDFTNTSINREELKFFNFISRLRNLFIELFYELLKRQAISKGIASEEEWEEISEKIRIKFISENAFFEKMERDKLNESLELFQNVSDLTGKFFSYNYIMKKVLKLTDLEIKNMSAEIEKEKKSKIYKKFYEDDDDY